MDELERYLARRRRRQLFVVTIRDPDDEQARQARLKFQVSGELVFSPGHLSASGPLRLWLSVDGSGPVDFEDRMVRDGWTKTTPGYSDPRGPQYYSYRRDPPPDDRPATLAAIARGAAAALMGTDRYLLAIEPFQGQGSMISEAAGYRSLSTMGGFLVGAPVAIVIALLMRNPLDLAMVGGALVAMAALYLRTLSSDPELEEVLLRFEATLGESAVVEVPIVGPLIELILSLAVVSKGVWVPIAIALAITRPVPLPMTREMLDITPAMLDVLLFAVILGLTGWAVIRNWIRYGSQPNPRGAVRLALVLVVVLSVWGILRRPWE